MVHTSTSLLPAGIAESDIDLVTSRLFVGYWYVMHLIHQLFRLHINYKLAVY